MNKWIAPLLALAAQRYFREQVPWPRPRYRSFLHMEPLEDRTVPSTCQVINTGDTGMGSGTSGDLRYCITQVNQSTDPANTIVFAAGVTGTITLTSELPHLETPVAIQGPGAATLTVSGNHLYRDFYVDGVTATISGLTVADGFTPSLGGGIYNYHGSLTVSNTTLSGSSAVAGAGIENLSGTLTVSGSTFSGNSTGGHGGGIDTTGTATVSNSTFAANSAQGGGGIFNGIGGTLTVSASTFSANTATTGGGIDNRGDPLAVSNSTFAGNTANFGGGLYTSSLAAATLTNLTVANNQAGSAGGGLFVNFATTPPVLHNTLIAGNLNSATSARDDVNGAVDAASNFNLIGDGTGLTGISDGTNGNQVGSSSSPINPLLAPLGAYGGPTQTVALLPGSPAIDAGSSTYGGPTDQRGMNRVGATDIGAFESQGFTVTPSSGNGQSTAIDTAFAQPLTVTVTANAPGEPVQGGVVTFTAPGSGPSATFPGGPQAVIGANGQASVSAVANANAGSYTVTAQTRGASSPATFMLRNFFPTAVMITSSLPVSVYGQSVTFTATVTGGGGPAQGGTVTFSDNGFILPNGMVPLNSNGQAMYTIATLMVAGNPHHITADYSGSELYGPGTGTTTQTVMPAPLTVTANDAMTAQGQPLPPCTVRYSGFVLGEGPGNLMGTLTCHTNAMTDSQGLVISPPGTYSWAPGGLTSTNYAITFVSGTLTVASAVVLQTDTVLNLQPAKLGSPITLRATVHVHVVGAIVTREPPVTVGTVTFTIDGTALAPVPVSSTGQATLSVTSLGLGLGRHTVTANYTDTIDFQFGNSSATGFQQVHNAAFFAIGGSNGQVQIYMTASPSLAPITFTPYPGYTGPVNVAFGDITGDGYDDLVTGAAAGNPDVRVYDGKAFANHTFNPANPNASMLAQWFPYALQFNVGATVAVGDVSGNGFDDIVTGASVGNPDVRVYSGQAIATGAVSVGTPPPLLAQWFPYALGFNIGANVAAGDVTGSGYADVVTGPTAGNPDVRVFSGRDIATTGAFNPTGTSLLAQWFAYALQFNVGASVAVGDINGSGYGDVITGATTGNPQVKVYDGQAIANGTLTGATAESHVLDQFYAYALGQNMGVTVGASDFETNGQEDILTGATNGPPIFKVFRGTAMGVSPPAVFEGTATGFPNGISVGAAS